MVSSSEIVSEASKLLATQRIDGEQRSHFTNFDCKYVLFASSKDRLRLHKQPATSQKSWLTYRQHFLHILCSLISLIQVLSDLRRLDASIGSIEILPDFYELYRFNLPHELINAQVIFFFWSVYSLQEISVHFDLKDDPLKSLKNCFECFVRSFPTLACLSLLRVL